MTIDEQLDSSALLQGRMPLVVVSGDATARGNQQGEAMRDAIGECIAIYDDTFKLAEDEIVRRAGHFEAVTRAWHADLAAEIDAIAAASGHASHWLWALNARSEIMSHVGAEASECTSVWSPSTQILAQNWDWMASLEPLTIALDATHEDGHHVVTVTEPGIVGKVGMSSAGTAVGLNFLSSHEPLQGVPVHVLLRALLDARNGDAVEDALTTAGAGRSGHVFLGRSSGVGSSIEYTGAEMLRRDSSDEPLLHTNHFVNGDTSDVPDPGVGADNSQARYDRSVQVLEARGMDTEADVRALLDDQGNSEFPICRPWAKSATLPGVDVGTVCAISMRLADGEIDIRLGPDPKGSWQTHQV